MGKYTARKTDKFEGTIHHFDSLLQQVNFPDPITIV